MNKNSKSENRLLKRKWVAAIPFICVIVFFLLSYCLEILKVPNAYGWSSLVFLIIPLAGYIVGLKKFRLSFPILISVIYVVVCLVASAASNREILLWHPLWVIFLTIPIYYIFFGEKITKKRVGEYVEDAKVKYKNDFGADDQEDEIINE